MKRRDFLRVTLLGGAVATVFPAALSGKGRGTGKGKPGFTLWQLPSQVDTIGNSYVLQTDGGRLVVMDGGMKDETLFLKGFLAALGNEVEAWFVSHPHNDHMGALTEILKKPGDLKIRKIYHSRFSDYDHPGLGPRQVGRFPRRCGCRVRRQGARRTVPGRSELRLPADGPSRPAGMQRGVL